VIVDQSAGTTSRTGENRGDAGMGGGHDVTEQSHLISSMAQCGGHLMRTDCILITSKKCNIYNLGILPVAWISETG
jgi:hypothetical protein